MNPLLAGSFSFGWISVPLIVCLVAVAVIIFVRFKPLIIAGIIAASIALMVISWKDYQVLGDQEFYTIVAWRYACAFIIFVLSWQDLLLTIHTDYVVYNSLGFEIGTFSVSGFIPHTLMGFAYVGIGALFADVLIPFWATGIPFSSFVPFAVLATIQVILSNLTSIIGFIRALFARIRIWRYGA